MTRPYLCNFGTFFIKKEMVLQLKRAKIGYNSGKLNVRKCSLIRTKELVEKHSMKQLK